MKTLKDQLKVAEAKINEWKAKHAQAQQKSGGQIEEESQRDANRTRSLEAQLEEAKKLEEATSLEAQQNSRRIQTLEEESQRDANRIQDLEAQLEEAKKLEEAASREAQQNSGRILSLEDRIQNFEVQLEEAKRREDKQHFMRRQALREGSQQDANRIKNLKAQLEEAKKCEAHTRKLELHVVRKVQENDENWSLDELKDMMASLDTRVTQLRNVLKPREKPSKTQKVVELLSKLFKNGVEMDRVDVVESISDLNRELSDLQRKESAAMARTGDKCSDTHATITQNEKDGATNGQTRLRDESSDDEARSTRKRARVSVSPWFHDI